MKTEVLYLEPGEKIGPIVYDRSISRFIRIAATHITIMIRLPGDSTVQKVQTGFDQPSTMRMCDCFEFIKVCNSGEVMNYGIHPMPIEPDQ